MCASSILCLVSISPSKMALGSDSSEILIVDYHESRFLASIANGGCCDPNEPICEIKQSLKLFNNERVISMAASKRLPLLAVGMLDNIRIFDLTNSSHNVNISVPYMQNVSTIIWALIFV